MLDELMFINHWLKSKDPYFMRKYGIDNSYFIALKEVVEWIERFRDDMGGQMPSIETVAVEFEDFRILSDLDPIEYSVSVLREQRAYMDYRPVLVSSAELANQGKTLEAMWKMRNDLDRLLKRYVGQIGNYDWVKHALDRYNKYMEKHGIEGLTGITTGIKALDDLTGGWKDDDLILIAGRTNEGKSWVGEFFAFQAWLYFVKAKINDPVIYITTEMPELEVAYRLDAFKAHFSNRALNEGKLTNPDLYKEYLEDLSKKDTSFLILSQEANRGHPFTAVDIRAIIESEKPGLLVIDQLYDLHDGTGESDIRKRIVNVSNQVRELNLSTRTPTILLAQAGRESARDQKKDQNASPELHQIQESDNPAQKATKVITLRKIDDVFKLSLKKNRGGERNKDVFVRTMLDTGVWEEISESELAF